jgi:general secretion pathway protein N
MKRSRLSFKRAPFLLLLLCLGLGGALYLEISQPPVEALTNAHPVSPAAGQAVPHQSVFVMPPVGTYGEVTERPLFSETRRAPAETAATPVDAPPSDFTLKGIIISTNERHALIEHGQPPSLERISEGQDLEGWTVESILVDRVVLTRADGRLELKAKDVPGLPGPPTPGGGRPIIQPKRPAANLPSGEPALAGFGVQPGIALTGQNPAVTQTASRPDRQR